MFLQTFVVFFLLTLTYLLAYCRRPKNPMAEERND